MWDWADGEPDDLTKNYPFPVPRVRDIPSKLRTECCSLHSGSTAPMATEAELQNVVANNSRVLSHDPAPPSANVTVTADGGNHTSNGEDIKVDEDAKVNEDVKVNEVDKDVAYLCNTLPSDFIFKFYYLIKHR